MPRLKPYIYQKTAWPHFTWRDTDLVKSLAEARNMQGRLLGKMEGLGFSLRDEALLDTVTTDVLKSAEIESEFYDMKQVRSSVARHLGMEIAGSVESDRFVDGMVEMMLDATQNCFAPLTTARLFDWHGALFPSGRSGMHKITVANWRKDDKGPMQVVSGAMGKEKVHFEAPHSKNVPEEMQTFLKWFNSEKDLEPVLKAAVAHLWFLTIHPFDDGNGRIARALTDMLLARADKINQRYYSMSAQIRLQRKQYYQILEKTQQGNMDITPWMHWFLNCLKGSLIASEELLKKVLFKADFWNRYAKTTLNERQIAMLNELLDGFDGKLTSSKWAKINKCSKDSAIRDINDLIKKGILQKEAAGGRGTNYQLKTSN